MHAATSTPTPTPSLPRRSLAVSTVAFVLILLSAFAAGESTSLSAPMKLVFLLLPVPAWALVLRNWWLGLRAKDELQVRIQLEAFGIAFGLTSLFALTLGLLQRVMTLSPDDWSFRHFWAMMPSLYFLGQMIAGRRYR
jgi:hypothetical protein